jgi:hypothetical protein
MIRRRTPKFWTDERLAELRELMLRDLRYREIGEHFKITEKSICQAVRNHSDVLPARYKGWRPAKARTVVNFAPPPVKVPDVMISDIPWPTKAELMRRRA